MVPSPPLVFELPCARACLPPCGDSPLCACCFPYAHLLLSMITISMQTEDPAHMHHLEWHEHRQGSSTVWWPGWWPPRLRWHLPTASCLNQPALTAGRGAGRGAPRPLRWRWRGSPLQGCASRRCPPSASSPAEQPVKEGKRMVQGHGGTPQLGLSAGPPARPCQPG